MELAQPALARGRARGCRRDRAREDELGAVRHVGGVVRTAARARCARGTASRARGRSRSPPRRARGRRSRGRSCRPRRCRRSAAGGRSTDPRSSAATLDGAEGVSGLGSSGRRDQRVQRMAMWWGLAASSACAAACGGGRVRGGAVVDGGGHGRSLGARGGSCYTNDAAHARYSANAGRLHAIRSSDHDLRSRPPRGPRGPRRGTGQAPRLAARGPGEAQAVEDRIERVAREAFGFEAATGPA